jgi:hypothetical protein
MRHSSSVAWQTGLDDFRNLIDPLEGWIAASAGVTKATIRSA